MVMMMNTPRPRCDAFPGILWLDDPDFNETYKSALPKYVFVLFVLLFFKF